MRGHGEVVGRDDEIRAVAAFVDGCPDGPGSLVLEGPAGIGKTTLWHAGVARAEANGVRVLTARPAATEAGFGLGALADLLHQVSPDTIDELPAPQRRALRVVQLLEDTTEPLDTQLLGVAGLGVLRALAQRSPVLVAIDDVQWLDAASAEVVGFLSRRLTAEPVRVFATRRTEETGPRPALPEPQQAVPVGPLSVGALQRLLVARLEVALGRHALRRVFDVAGGNPFYALEVARSLAGRQPSLREPISVPTDLKGLLRERLERLPPETRALLLAAALLHEPTLDALEALTGQGAWALLRPARDAQLVETDGLRMHFSHPLFAAAVVDEADPLERRRLHARVAALVTNPAERARHLALGSEPPDELIAVELENAARHEQLRGAAYAAADLAHEAWRFSADPERRAERLLQACEHRLLVGGFAEIIPQLESSLDSFPAGSLRARALFLLARAEYAGGRKGELLAAALAESNGDARLRATILIEQMSFHVAVEVTAEASERQLEEAVALARAAGDPDLEDRARGNHAWWLAVTGRPVPRATRLRPHAVADDVERARAVQLVWRGETEAARGLLLRLRERAGEVGEEWSQLIFTLHLFELEARRGDWPAVERLRAELHGAGAGIDRTDALLHRADALVAAAAGDRRRAEAAADAVVGAPDRWQKLETVRAAAFAALALGDPENAAERLRWVFDETLAGGFREPGAIPAAPDLVEALAQLGRDEEAREVLAWLAARATEQDHPWGLALAARGRGIVDRDESALRESLARLEQLSLPFERARTLLALGALLRRAGRRGDARAVLTEARELFERLEAPPWAVQAASELARIGGRTASGSLTPAEQRVAALVAEGRTKKEVAAALFLSVHTVDSTLRRVYAKLGVRSRAELARRMA
ncbi:MAG TPA: AAA family ATPase [Gaiellaceae bacterium]|nr:AAA family ATPase [Gaiellaceae bacterium]